MPTNKGWRRLWPSVLWLHTYQIAGGDLWNWEITSSDKVRKLACGAESYTRSQAAAFAGVKFGADQMKVLEESERKRSATLQMEASEAIGG